MEDGETMIIKYDNKAIKYTNKWISVDSQPTPPTIYHVTTSGTHGTVTASPTEGISGTEVTLSNTPDTHYHFGSYSLTGATLKNANQFDIADSDVSVVGNFIEDTKYSVTCTNDGHGTISAYPTSNYSGSTVTLSNTPNTGYNFDKYTIVSGTGASISGNTLTIGTSNVTVRGDFIAIPVDYVQIGNLLWKTVNTDTYVSSGMVDEYPWGSGSGRPRIRYYNTTGVSQLSSQLSDGWRIPTYNDFQALSAAVNNNPISLCATSPYWSGTNTTGFNALPAGIYYYSELYGVGTAAEFYGINCIYSFDTTDITLEQGGDTSIYCTVRLCKNVT